MSARQSHLFESIQGILGNSGLESISSIEQLEELMLMEAIRQSINASNESVNSVSAPIQTTPGDSPPVIDNTQGTTGPLGQTNVNEHIDRESTDLSRSLDAVVIDESLGLLTAHDIGPTEATAQSSVEDPINSDSIELLMPDETTDPLFLEDEEQMRLAMALSIADIGTATDH